jgi:4-amino-4-deoxy-L-arabinose transferase-like glycosyltransferase
MILKVVIAAIFLSFGFLMVNRALTNMKTIPMHDFDEANRAEGARNMRLQGTFLAPLTGSPYGRAEDHSVSFKEGSLATIWPHYERPPLAFILMAQTSKYLGDNEFAYRLPSFVFSLLTLIMMVCILWKFNFMAGSIGILIMITSTDRWLSAQYAQQDTIFVFFLIGAMAAIFRFVEIKTQKWKVISGIMVGLAILARAQPAILIFLPLLSLLITKRIKFLDTMAIIIISTVVASPWYIGLSMQYGLAGAVNKMLSVATSRATEVDLTQSAPVYWYLRLWLDTLRPGLIIFLSLIADRLLTRKRLNWKQTALLWYIVGGFMLFSLAKNSVWWYVLPLLSGIAWLSAELVRDYLEQKKNNLMILSFIIILASAPIVLLATTTETFLYGIALFTISVILLRQKVFFSLGLSNLGFVFAVIISLSLFYLRFPAPQPTYAETKEVASFYEQLPEPKCLLVSEMPYEAALFYSKAGEINYYPPTPLRTDCTNYLITRLNLNYQVIARKGQVIMYRLP